MKLKQTPPGRRTDRQLSTFGYRTLMAAGLACSLLGGSLSQAATVGYWRFEDDGGFLNDSGPNGLDLTLLPGEEGDLGDATQAAIPDSGPGSTFGDAISGNTQMAAFAPDLNKGDGFVVDDDDAFSVTAFTIEALIHRESNMADDNIPVWNVAGHYNTKADFGGENDRSWDFFVRDGEGLSDFGQLELAVSSNGAFSGYEKLPSAIVLDTDKDYYVAVSFDLSNQTDGVTFYAKDLTGGGPMQVEKLGHTRTALHNAVGEFNIGKGHNPSQNQGDGFIDEVRLSNVALDPSELLVPTVLGDFDGDDDVDGADFLKWQRELGDATNLGLWQDNFGTPAAPAVAAVPEPASWILICTMMALIAPRRRHPFL